jgi:hypothetical protein
MKQGLSIQDLARELERQRQTKKDFVSDTRELTFHSGPSSFLSADPRVNLPLSTLQACVKSQVTFLEILHSKGFLLSELSK